MNTARPAPDVVADALTGVSHGDQYRGVSTRREGLGPRDAAARLVIATGKPRRQLYQLALSLRPERGDRK